jgi:hypothetical protein
VTCYARRIHLLRPRRLVRDWALARLCILPEFGFEQKSVRVSGSATTTRADRSLQVQKGAYEDDFTLGAFVFVLTGREVTKTRAPSFTSARSADGSAPRRRGLSVEEDSTRSDLLAAPFKCFWPVGHRAVSFLHRDFHDAKRLLGIAGLARRKVSFSFMREQARAGAKQ